MYTPPLLQLLRLILSCYSLAPPPSHRFECQWNYGFGQSPLIDPPCILMMMMVVVIFTVLVLLVIVIFILRIFAFWPASPSIIWLWWRWYRLWKPFVGLCDGWSGPRLKLWLISSASHLLPILYIHNSPLTCRPDMPRSPHVMRRWICPSTSH